MLKSSKKLDDFVYYISLPMNLRAFCRLLKALYRKMESGGCPRKRLEATASRMSENAILQNRMYLFSSLIL